MAQWEWYTLGRAKLAVAPVLTFRDETDVGAHFRGAHTVDPLYRLQANVLLQITLNT